MRRRANRSGWVDPHWRLMLRPHRLDTDASHVEPQFAEQTGGHRRGRAVCAVDSDSHPGAVGSRQDLSQVLEVIGVKIDFFDRRCLFIGHRPRRVSNNRLDAPLESFGELLSSTGKYLDAVVFKWVM